MNYEEKKEMFFKKGFAPTLKDLFETEWTDEKVVAYNKDLEEGMDLMRGDAFGEYLCKEFIELVDTHFTVSAKYGFVDHTIYLLKIATRPTSTYRALHILEKSGLNREFRMVGANLLEASKMIFALTLLKDPEEKSDPADSEENPCNTCDIRDNCPTNRVGKE